MFSRFPLIPLTDRNLPDTVPDGLWRNDEGALWSPSAKRNFLFSVNFAASFSPVQKILLIKLFTRNFCNPRSPFCDVTGNVCNLFSLFTFLHK